MKKYFVFKAATLLSMIAAVVVSIDSFLLVHQPVTPEELR
ncbi:cyclic lactone autoinducer peptide [Paenibacillus graminis]|nr:cyclic lactone autoinducer peptide [Paenibacillus graminis]MEC0168626.1 cyclic lactone autoinducer peptide [Paenibacillus graminis]